MVKYHPKFWTEGIYQCCRQTEKLAPGCEKYNLFENSKYICSHIKLFWHIFLLFYVILSSHLNALGTGQIYRAERISDTVPEVNQSVCFISRHFVKNTKASELSSQRMLRKS